jgi:serine/threonine-protein kinase
MSDGTIRCWGDNTSGQLGTMSAGSYGTVGVQVDTINDATSISANNLTTCALRSKGEVWCWGNDAYGSVDGTARSGSGIVPTPTGPTVSGAIAVSVGSTFTCAIAPGDAGFDRECWGERPYANGQMTTPGVADLGSTDATALACGYSACVDTDGTNVELFGEDTDDQLQSTTNTGNITFTAGVLPTPVTGVTMGTSFGCGFGGTNGVVTCWGDDAFDELGSSATGPPSPSAMVGISTVTSLSAGGMHACAVSGGGVLCWGDNAMGQLGVGNTAIHTGLQILALSDVDEVATGTNGTCVRQGATVTCWGDAYLLGDGSAGTGVQSAPGAPVQLQ